MGFFGSSMLGAADLSALGVPLPESASADFGVGTHDGASINVTPPTRYGSRPSVYGGGDMLALPGRSAPPMAVNTAAEQPTGQAPTQPHKKKRGGFGGFLKAWAGYLGDSLTGTHVYADAVERQRRAQLPQQVGDSLIVADPSQPSGYRTIFRDPQPFEAYAAALGFQPGTPEYIDAVQNYRLGSWSDAAVDAKTGLVDHRYDRQDQMIDHRFDRSDKQLDRRLDTQRDIAAGHDRTSRENTRYRVDNAPKRPARPPGRVTPEVVIGRIMDKQSRGLALTAAEQKTLTEYRSSARQGRKRSGASAGSGAVIVNPRTGERMTLQNGQWVPIR